MLLIAVFLCGIIVGVKIRRSIEEEQNTNDLIQKYATEYDVPYDIVCAVIETESSFQSDAISSTGARGLMQINKITLTDLNQRLGTDYSMDDLFDPAINIRLGTFYLSHLYKRFGNYETVYAAYNAGPTRVAEWLTDSQYSKDGITLIHDNIPYAETKRYVEKVIKNYQARQGS